MRRRHVRDRVAFRKSEAREDNKARLLFDGLICGKLERRCSTSCLSPSKGDRRVACRQRSLSRKNESLPPADQDCRTRKPAAARNDKARGNRLVLLFPKRRAPSANTASPWRGRR